MTRPTLVTPAITLALWASLGCATSQPGVKAPAVEAPTAAEPMGQAPPATASTLKAAATKPSLEKPLLWRATKGEQTVYLLGTIHMGVAADELPTRVWEAFATSKHVAIEANINDLSLVTGMLRKGGPTLQEELGPQTWGKLVALLGADEAKGLARFKTFVTTMRVQMHGLDVTPGVDLGVIERATSAGKPLAYLEAGALQMGLLEKWMTAKVVTAMIGQVGKLQAANATLISAYRSGEEAALIAANDEDNDAAAMGLTEAEAAQMEYEMLEQRNASWIAPIEKLAADGPAFIAVGAMHLIGDKSVAKMLSDRGWKVVRQ